MSDKLRFLDEDGSLYPDWEEGTLGDATNIVGGGTPSTTKDEYWNGDIEWFSPSEITSRYVSSSRKRITKAGLKNSSAKLLPPGAILLTTRATLGRMSILTTEAATNQGFQSLIPISGKTTTEYLFQLQPFIETYCKAKATGSTFLEVSKRALEKMPLSLPSLPEQEKIADFLGALDDRIELQEKKIELLKERKRGWVQRIFSQRVRFRDDNGNEYPEWEEKTLGELVDTNKVKLARGVVISKDDMAALPGQYPVYSSSALNEGYMGSYGKYHLDEELITWSIDGGGRLFYRPKHKFSVTNVSGILHIEDKENIDPFYLHLALHEQWKRYKFDYQIKAHPSVIVKLYDVALPCFSEQKKIAAFVRLLDEDIVIAARKMELLRAQKQGYLQRIFA